MTTEEKARRYDEAVKRAKTAIDLAADKDLVEGVVRTILPELKENENERTRKEIIHYLSYTAGGLSTEEQNRWIAYLEKQKEPLPIPDKFSGLKSLMLQYLQSAANRKDDTEIERDTDLWGRKVLDYVWKYSDEQKEKNEITIKQVYKEFINPEKLKDAKTNKYIRAQLFWELAHNGIITAVDYQYLIDDNRKPWTEEEYLKAYRKGFDVSEQLNYRVKEEKQKEQNPLTTEETELNSIAFLEQMGYTCIPPRKEQKPAEWSEFDESCKQTILCAVQGKFVTDAALRQAILWLKSLSSRPKSSDNWKPTEEQMNEMEFVINDYREDSCNATANYLQEILDHLKNM